MTENKEFFYPDQPLLTFFRTDPTLNYVLNSYARNYTVLQIKVKGISIRK